MVDVTTQAVITVKREDRVHMFHCANNANLGELFDVLSEMRGYIIQRINEAQAAEQAQKSAIEAPREE